MESRKCPNCGGDFLPGTYKCQYCGTDWTPATSKETKSPEKLLAKISLTLAIVSMILVFKFIYLSLFTIAAGFHFGIRALKDGSGKSDGNKIQNLAIAGIALCAIAVIVVIFTFWFRVQEAKVYKYVEREEQRLTTDFKNKEFARSNGRMIQRAEELYFKEHQEYTDDLSKLDFRGGGGRLHELEVNFLQCDSSGYTFTVKHPDYVQKFTFMSPKKKR